MKDPVRCSSPACGSWTFRADGYCSDECARIVPMSAARGIGMVTPPRDVRYSARPRVRRNEGFIAGNGAWIATDEAPYTEFSRDVRELETRSRRAKVAAQKSIARVTAAAKPDPQALIRTLAAANGGNPDA